MSILKNIISVFSTQVFEKFVRQLNSIVLARFIGPSGLGLYSLFFSLAQNFFIFFEFGLGASGIFHIRRKLNSEQKVIENVVVFSFVAGLLCSFIIYFFRNEISNFFLDDNPIYIMLLALVVPIIIISSIFSILSRGLKRFDIYNTFVLIRPIVFLIVIFFFLILLGGNIFHAILAQIISIFLAGFWIMYKLYGLYNFKIKFHKDVFIQNIKYGFKQHILKISLMIIGSAQIYLLKYFTDTYTVGQFAIIMSMIGLVAFFKNSISFVLTPTVSELDDSKIHYFIARASRFTFYTTLISSIIVAIVGVYYVRLLYGHEFNYASNAFIFYLPGIIFHSICVILHRDFTHRTNPIQSIPIYAYSLGSVIITIFSYLMLNNYSDFSLEVIGVVYCFSHLTVLIFLLIYFKLHSDLKIRDIFILSKDDISLIRFNINKILKNKNN